MCGCLCLCVCGWSLAHIIAGKVAWLTLCDVKTAGASGRSLSGLGVGSPARGGIVPGASVSVLGRDSSRETGGYVLGVPPDSVPPRLCLEKAPSVMESDAMSTSDAVVGSLPKGSLVDKDIHPAGSAPLPGALDPSWLCPLHSLVPSGAASVSVTGYIQGVALENSRDKTMFLVSVCHEDKAEVSGAAKNLSFAPTYRTVKKRFKQFRSLHTVLQQCDERFDAIVFPSTSKAVDVATGEEFDTAAPEAQEEKREMLTMNRSKASSKADV